MNTLQKLTALFAEFPGIGPRQAKRFVYFLLTRNKSYLNEITSLITKIHEEIQTCDTCFRFYIKNTSGSHSCDICNAKNRDISLLTVVSRDVDFEHIEKTGAYNGLYFILGGTIPILEPSPEKRVRLRELLKLTETRATKLKEIILAMNANPEGEHTGDSIKKSLETFALKHDIKISFLGRGLSTGTELEYSDNETLKNALKNRQ